MACNSASAVSHGQGLYKTTSRCSTESVTVTHDFEVANYPLLDGIGAGKIVRSSKFSAGGYDWCIKFYPDGVNKDCGLSASAFLNYLSTAKDVRTKFTLNMLDEEGIIHENHGLLEHSFSPASFDWGFYKFVQKPKLGSLSDLRHSYFVIRCILTVIKEPRTEVKRNFVMVPQPNLQDHLEHMRKDGEGADVTFSVSGQLFNAHRYLLAARSPVFKAELFGPMKEKATQCIKIEGIEPQIFDALLHFVYTDSMLDDENSKEGNAAKLQHLLVAADRYGLERLNVMCGNKLREIIGVETVATTLVLAEQHHRKDLREACIEFIASPKMLREVMATDGDGFQHLLASCPLVLKDILDKMSTRDD